MCKPPCIINATGSLIPYNSTVRSADGCGYYECPPFNQTNADSCIPLSASYRPDPCPVLDNPCLYPEILKNLSVVCCPKIKCDCPPVVDPNCTDPHEVTTYTTRGLCTTDATCTCECPDVSSNCSRIPGCKVVPEEVSAGRCACLEKYVCDPDLSLCPEKPNCSPCESLAINHAGSGQKVCFDFCPVYQCQPIGCPPHPPPPLSCPSSQSLVKIFSPNDTNKCCPVTKCECEPDAILNYICPHWNFMCGPDYILNRTNPQHECCPSYKCLCNKTACPLPISCANGTHLTPGPPGGLDMTHAEVCCSTYSCTCNSAECPLKPNSCPLYRTLRASFKDGNRCCPFYSCECDPDKYPDDFTSSLTRESANNTCILPGQQPLPDYDDTGCLGTCLCYPNDQLLMHCPEYLALNNSCPDHKVLVNVTAPADDSNYVCCPKYNCTCPDCGQDFITREEVEAGRAPGETVVAKAPLTECCQQYHTVCVANAETSDECVAFVLNCSEGFKLQRNFSNVGCCPAFHCECDLDLCASPPSCNAPRVLTKRLESHNACCFNYTCKCPPDPNENLTCGSPYVLGYTETACPSKYCACPERCPPFPSLDCQHKPGCRVVPVATDSCGCAVNVTCVGDNSTCAVAPSCGICSKPVPISVELVVENCNSTCPKYECRDEECPSQPTIPYLCDWNENAWNISNRCCPTPYVVCDVTKCPKLTCPAGHHKEVVEGSFWDDDNNCSDQVRCCPLQKCVCDVCKHGKNLYNVGEEWSNSSLTCSLYKCSLTRTKPDGCFALVESPPTCTYYHVNGTRIEVPAGGEVPFNRCFSVECEVHHVNNTCHPYPVIHKETCQQSPACSPYEELHKSAIEGSCCFEEGCRCRPCGPTYVPLPGRNITMYEIAVNATLEENPNQKCCPRTRYICANATVLSQTCPEWNRTCGIGRKRRRVNSEDECCPRFECVCKPCLQHTGLSPVHPCEIEINRTTAENPLQDCCPFTKLTCKNNTSCCGEGYETYEQLLLKLELGETVAIVPGGHGCCPTYRRVCSVVVENSLLCSPYNKPCPDGFRRQRNESNVGCCPTYHCVVDESLCPPKPDCQPPKELLLEASSEYCKRYKCVCPVEKNNGSVCEHPKEKTVTDSVCPRSFCRCPEECPDNAQVQDCLLSPGCRVNVTERDLCNCVKSAACLKDEASCPAPPNCGTCFEARPVGLFPDAGECRSPCQNYTCEKTSCSPASVPDVCALETRSSLDNGSCCPASIITCKPAACPEINCSDGWVGQFKGRYHDDLPEYNCTSGSKCCPLMECVCEVCFDNGVPYGKGEIWQDDLDPCKLKKCTNTMGSDGCYTIETHLLTCKHKEKAYPIGAYVKTEHPCRELACVLNRTADQCISTMKQSYVQCPNSPLCNEYHIPNATYHPGQCCPEYACVCNGCGPRYSGPGPARAPEWYEMTVNKTDEENPNQQCCPLSKVVCDESKFHLCPQFNLTCGVGKDRIEAPGTHPCCPEYDCQCRECYDIAVVRPSFPCQEVVFVPAERNPNHECCPLQEVVCTKNKSCCDVPTCGENEIARNTSLMDPSTGFCCPLYECVCSGNCLAGYRSKESLLTSLELGEELVIDIPDNCCPTYKVVCSNDSKSLNICSQFTVRCVPPLSLRRNITDVGCCPVYYCECDTRFCPTAPECQAPTVLQATPTLDGCCNVYECVCPAGSTKPVVCNPPLIMVYTETTCPSAHCRCPDANECPVSAAVNCTSNPGCTARVTKWDKCGCPVTATCEHDPASCTPPPQCPVCFEMRATPFSNRIGGCNSTCMNYTCERLQCTDAGKLKPCQFEILVTTHSEDWCCPKEEVVCVRERCPTIVCGEHYAKVVMDDYLDPLHNCSSNSSCCRREECVCDVCFHNGTAHPLWDTWKSSADPCTRYQCTHDRGSDGCYAVNIITSRCIYNHQEYPVDSIIATHDPCSTLKCSETRHDNGTCFVRFEQQLIACPDPLSCDTYYYPELMRVPGECCPTYQCVCRECIGDNYQSPDSMRALEWYETTRNMTLAENPNQLCCPMIKIVCNAAALIRCPTANLTCDMGQNKVAVNTTHPCCPRFECQCHNCRDYVAPVESDLKRCQAIVLKTPDENPYQQCCPEKKIVCNDSCCSPPACNTFEIAYATGLMDLQTNGCCLL